MAFWNKKEESISEGDIFSEQKEKALSIVSNFTDGILLFDKTNHLSFLNPQAEKTFEVSREEVLGKSTIELNNFKNFKPLISLLGEETKEFLAKELQFKDNFVLEASASYIMGREERTGTLVILHDITQRQLQEAQKASFISLTAHQLQTPTSEMKWAIRSLLDGDKGQVSEEQKLFIEKIYNSNERAINLISDLLNVSRIEEGKMLSQVASSSIEEVIQSVVAVFEDDIKRKKLQFQFKKPSVLLPKIMVDAEKIKMAINNLIDNAVRYTPKGGKINIIVEQKGNEIEFQIQDTGVGIPESQKDKIFNKFFRARNVFELEEGTGLGLFITKNIIELHGGKIWFESVEGEGTIFYFTLPIENGLKKE